MKYEEYLKLYEESLSKLEQDLQDIDSQIESLQIKKGELKEANLKQNTDNFMLYQEQLNIETSEEIKRWQLEKEKAIEEDKNRGSSGEVLEEVLLRKK